MSATHYAIYATPTRPGFWMVRLYCADTDEHIHSWEDIPIHSALIDAAAKMSSDRAERVAA